MGIVMRFLGTAAAEGIPNPFCSCALCSNAREKGGREIKTRAAFRVTDDVQIDFGPDSYMQSVFMGNDLLSLKDILITHAHDDHIAPFEINLVEMVYGKLQHEINFYFTAENYRMLQALDDLAFEGSNGYFTQRLKGMVDFHILQFNETYAIGDIYATPLKSTHKSFFDSMGANYLVALPDHRKFLYAVDTGYYTEDTLERLQNERLDYLIIECTFGSAWLAEDDNQHLNIMKCDALMSKMYRNNTITDHTKVYITHMNHKHTFTHKDMEDYYNRLQAPYPVVVAYDGLTVR
jgi:phosphoribosyl 1,2-cyclic phosphate phosphodiesterase